jgi:hypothetical protein
MKDHPGGSHSKHARPDEKMGRGKDRSRRDDLDQRGLTSVQNRTLKKVAAKKRRQR